MSRKLLRSLIVLVCVISIYHAKSLGSRAFPPSPYQAIPVILQDTIPLGDRTGDFINSGSTNPFDLQDPNIIQQNVEYDPETGQYIITERIGEDYFRPPTYMTFEEYNNYIQQQQQQSYFNQLSGFGEGDRGASGKVDPIAKIDVKNSLVDRLFGGTDVKIEPQGNVDLTFGVSHQNIENPGLLQRTRRQTNFDFKMAIQMDVQGQIGEKLKLNAKFNNNQTFEADRLIKLNYDANQFTEDDIIQKIEAGNVSLPLRGSLIQGSQSLFGLKTELQFGRLRLALLAAQQNSDRKNLQIESGGQVQKYKVTADQYDENKHFFLSHFNRETFEGNMESLPQIKTLFRVEKIQVFVTNDRNEPFNNYEVVALADLGEPKVLESKNPDLQPPSQPKYKDNSGRGLPDNGANPVYGKIIQDPRARQLDRVVSLLRSPAFNLQQGKDFEKVNARKLNESEFTYNAELGFISINTSIRPDQVVGVAFQYSYGDTVLQVGEFGNDIQTQLDSLSPPNVLFIKMLKSSTQRVGLPTWDLMMKNVYAIGAFQVNRQDFRLDIYYDDPGKGKKRFLPESRIAGKPLIQVFNLDNLNVQGDPQSDGVFDFLPGITINPRNGRIMFPVLEPFGDALAAQIDDASLRRKFVYDTLYSSTITTAREFANLNRFTIEGEYKSTISSEIQLGTFNLPPNSLRVTAGGVLLREGIDYEVNYSSGTVRILNAAYLQQGAPINVAFEDQSLFSFQQKTMLAARADYKVSKKMNVGATVLNLFERPFTQKVNIGDDPINNKVYGVDFNYSDEAPWLTKMVDALPLIDTKEKSTITVSAEAAALRPGYSRAITERAVDENGEKTGDKGSVNYIDDFEGAVSPIFLTSQPNVWTLASVPQNDQLNKNPLFPESGLVNDLRSSVNRANLSWYLIESFGANTGANTGINPYEVAAFSQQEVFKNFTPQNNLNAIIRPFTMTFNPRERGPYNFDEPNGTPYSAGVTTETSFGQQKIILNDPKTRWGGITRALNVNDFQASNVEFIEFWVLSPFLNTSGDGTPAPDADSKEGFLNFNFGNISEDVLRDSRWFFENGLPGPKAERQVDDTRWGRVPRGTSITNAFDLDPDNRSAQDVGFDGLDNASEAIKFGDYLTKLSNAGINIQSVQDDPANDDWVSFRNNDFWENLGAAAGVDIPLTERYHRFNFPHGNSPVQDGNANSATNLPYTNNPDSEDLDRDNSLSETEAYFQYKVPLKHDGNGGIDFRNNPYISDEVMSDDGTRKWYRFKVPLAQTEENEFFQKVGGIQDFRSIRFVRMYMTGFEEQVTLRFANLDLVRNQWRRYVLSLKDVGVGVPQDEAVATTFEVNEVNIEENSRRLPFSYVLPPGIRREQALGVNQNAQQNEASMSMRVCNLEDGDARAIYKFAGFDLRFFERMRMFVHAEKIEDDQGLQDGELHAFIRIGSDFTQNYYEYEIPITLSKETNIATNTPQYKFAVWPAENNFDILLETFKNLKVLRNNNGVPVTETYPFNGFDDPNRLGGLVRIKGNPNLGEIKGIMIGVKNPKDDGKSHCADIWVNELRTYGLSQQGGVAAIGRIDAQLADFGNIALAGSFNSIGYGGIDQPLLQRSRKQIIQYDAATNLELSRFMPKEWGIKLPFFAQYSRTIETPQFDPYDLDISLKEKIADIDDGAARDSLKSLAQDVTTIKSINFTNVRKERSATDTGKPAPWDIENFSVSYAYSNMDHRDPLIELDNLKTYRGALDYGYTRQAKYVQPLKSISSKYLQLLSEFNFNPAPNSLTFSTLMNRQLGTTKYRFASDREVYNTFYVKRWTWDRNYGLNWDLTKSLKFNFNAVNSSVIDEPEEFVTDENSPFFGDRIDRSIKRDSVLSNIRELGRTKNYNHTSSASYTVPLRFLPFMDWTNIKATYGSNYTWSAAALNVQSLGNVIQNGQNRRVDVDLDFERLYNNSKYLKKINDGSKGKPSGRSRGSNSRELPGSDDKNGRNKDAGGALGKDMSSGKSDKNKPQKGADTGVAGASGKDGNPSQTPIGSDGEPIKEKKEKKPKDPNATPSLAERIALRPLMLIRKGRVSYNEDFGTVVPGFMPGSKYLGMQENFGAPGWGFIAGLQPNINQSDYYTSRDWLYSNYQWISGDPLQNQQVIQTYSQKIDGRLTVEPFRDFKIDVDASRNYSSNHSERFARFNRDGVYGADLFQQDYIHMIPRSVGSYTISYFAMNTLFNNDITGMFSEFSQNRLDVSNRLGLGDHASPEQAAEGYTYGYGRYQQDVLIPAFLAAYTGKDAKTIAIDTNYAGNVLFKTLPKPNWRLSYNGLAKLPMFKNTFQSINITHAYKSTLTVNSFESDLQYNPNDPGFLNSSTQDYFATFEMPDMVIQEAFSPLIGVDVRMKNGMQFRMDYKKNRNLQMNFENRRLSEARGEDITVGFTHKVKEFKVPFGKKKKKASSKKDEKTSPFSTSSTRGRTSRGNPGDLDLSFDLSIRDDVTQIFTLDSQETPEPSRGTRTIRLSPAAEYRINKDLSLRFFTDFNRITPKTSNGFPTTNVQGGVVVRFSIN